MLVCDLRVAWSRAAASVAQEWAEGLAAAFAAAGVEADADADTANAGDGDGGDSVSAVPVTASATANVPVASQAAAGGSVMMQLFRRYAANALATGLHSLSSLAGPAGTGPAASSATTGAGVGVGALSALGSLPSSSVYAQDVLAHDLKQLLNPATSSTAPATLASADRDRGSRRSNRSTLTPALSVSTSAGASTVPTRLFYCELAPPLSLPVPVSVSFSHRAYPEIYGNANCLLITSSDAATAAATARAGARVTVTAALSSTAPSTAAGAKAEAVEAVGRGAQSHLARALAATLMAPTSPAQPQSHAPASSAAAVAAAAASDAVAELQPGTRRHRRQPSTQAALASLSAVTRSALATAAAAAMAANARCAPSLATTMAVAATGSVPAPAPVVLAHPQWQRLFVFDLLRPQVILNLPWRRRHCGDYCCPLHPRLQRRPLLCQQRLLSTQLLVLAAVSCRFALAVQPPRATPSRVCTPVAHRALARCLPLVLLAQRAQLRLLCCQLPVALWDNKARLGACSRRSVDSLLLAQAPISTVQAGLCLASRPLTRTRTRLEALVRRRVAALVAIAALL